MSDVPQPEPLPGDGSGAAPASVAALVALAREELRGHAPHRGERSFARVRERLAAGRRTSPRRVAWLPVGAAALAAAAAAVLVLQRSPEAPPLSYQVDGAQATTSELGTPERASQLTFSDGSTLELERGTRASVASIDDRGARLALREGGAEVAITKRPHARWSIDAGPYEVRVTGTAFALRWISASQRFELSMHEGEVWVTGPLIEDSLRLRAGQRVRADVANHQLAIDEPGPALARTADEAQRAPGAPAEHAAPALAAAATTPVATHAPADHAPSQATPRPAPRAHQPWARLVARGDFERVLQQAEAMGVGRALARVPLGELSALADAARFQQHGKLARRTLIVLRRRFPDSAAAADAAFVLGRLAEDGDRDGGAAGTWYGRYLAESPGGPHAADALGRSMVLRYRRDGAASALELARDYLRRHPRGSYAARARAIEGEADTEK